MSTVPFLGAAPLARPDDPAWLVARREQAASAVRATGLPTKKTESFRFTSVKPLVDVPFEAATPGAVDDVAQRLGDDGTFRVVLVDGRPDVVGTPPEGVLVRSLATMLREEPSRLEGHLGRLAGAEFFAGINAALFEDGLVVIVARGAAPRVPIHVVHAAAGGTTPVVAYPRLVVLVEPSSEATLVETTLGRTSGPHLVNEVAEIAVAANAHLTHVVVHEAPGYHVVRAAVRVDRDASYRARTVTLGGGLLRSDLHVVLDGEGASCSLEGVYHAAGKDHVDHHVLVEHRVPRCTSRQRYRGVVDGAATTVFDGIVLVRPGAQKTEAHQENKNLLLTNTATVHTKPHLEIEADDVVCSHGATIGSLDPDQLFYLRSRAVGEATARAMLTFAFVQEVLAQIPHEPVRRRLEDALLARLPEGASIRELV